MSANPELVAALMNVRPVQRDIPDSFWAHHDYLVRYAKENEAQKRIVYKEPLGGLLVLNSWARNQVRPSDLLGLDRAVTQLMDAVNSLSKRDADTKKVYDAIRVINTSLF